MAPTLTIRRLADGVEIISDGRQTITLGPLERIPGGPIAQRILKMEEEPMPVIESEIDRNAQTAMDCISMASRELRQHIQNLETQIATLQESNAKRAQRIHALENQLQSQPQVDKEAMLHKRWLDACAAVDSRNEKIADLKGQVRLLTNIIRDPFEGLDSYKWEAANLAEVVMDAITRVETSGSGEVHPVSYEVIDFLVRAFQLGEEA